MKNLLDVFYYPDLRNEVKKIRSLVASFPLPTSNTKKKEILNQINKKLFMDEREPSKILNKIVKRMYRKTKYVPSLSNVNIFKSSKYAFIDALNKKDPAHLEEVVIKYLQTYFKLMYNAKAFHSKKEYDKKYRGFEISFDVYPTTSKFAIVCAKKYMQWKSYLNSTARKAYAIVGLDDFNNSFIIFIPYGLANSIIYSTQYKQIDVKKIQQRIWGTTINYQIGRFGLVQIDRPINWHYKKFTTIESISPLTIERLLKIDKISQIQVGNKFYKIVNPHDEFGKIDSYEIIDQE
jgi:hypothetical protein